jgi:4-phosphopantoate--beta-alanine ligase
MLRNIPHSHPRARSLEIRELLVEGFRNGIVVEEGLIAHGRGEAFDYLVGEVTTREAMKAVRAAVALMLLAKRPVISVNGNTACLCAKETVRLAELANARMEVNLFYRTYEREAAIEKVLRAQGAGEIYGVGNRASMTIPELMSDRRRVDPDGIYSADVVLVPLEDGDRTEALVRMGKKVIAVDLNPLSRTSKKAHVTIVDNIVRAMPEMVELAEKFKGLNKNTLQKLVDNFDNTENLEKGMQRILKGMS